MTLTESIRLEAIDEDINIIRSVINKIDRISMVRTIIGRFDAK